MPAYLENTGSTARDFLMLERNLLSHVKLAMLLSLLASSVLLRARLTGSMGGGDPSGIRVPISTIDYAAAICAICAGVFQYYQTAKDYRTARGFLVATKCVLLVVHLPTI